MLIYELETNVCFISRPWRNDIPKIKITLSICFTLFPPMTIGLKQTVVSWPAYLSIACVSTVYEYEHKTFLRLVEVYGTKKDKKTLI